MSREAVLAVLERAAADIGFYSQLAEDPGNALKGYDLTWEEQAALISGDVRWIESHADLKIDERLMRKVFIPLLSRERW